MGGVQQCYSMGGSEKFCTAFGAGCMVGCSIY